MDVLHGIYGLAQASLGLRAASNETILQRQKICNMCNKLTESKSKKFKKYLHRCSVCGCFLYAKITLKNEKCPLDKWKPEPKKKD